MGQNLADAAKYVSANRSTFEASTIANAAILAFLLA